MKNWVRESLKFLVGAGIAAFFLYITLRDRSIGAIIEDLKDVKLVYVGLAGILLLVSHIFRTLRWQLLLEEAGNKVGFINTLNSVLICYGVNSLTPRLGEIARCTTLYKSENVPISNSLGTVIIERVADLFVLGIGIMLIFILEFAILKDLIFNVFVRLSHVIGSTKIWFGIGVFLVLGVLGIWILKNTRIKARTGRVGQKVFDFADGLWNSAKSVRSLKHPLKFTLYTIFIWAFLVFLTYAFFLALEDTKNLSFFFSFVVFFIGGLGWILPVPNGMGTFHYVVSQLFLAFGLSGEAGVNFAIIDNGGTLVVTLILGIAAYTVFLFHGRNPDSGNSTSSAQA
jgi:glycosyltransferase 2 family protein